MMRRYIDLMVERAHSEEFINELNHEIKVAVEEKDIEGVAGVLITIVGPDSESTNHITREEARMLLRELRLVLESDT